MSKRLKTEQSEKSREFHGRARRGVVGLVFCVFALTACRHESSSIENLRAVPPPGGDSNALNADLHRRGLDEAKLNWKPGFLSETDLTNPKRKLVSGRIEPDNWTGTATFEAMPVCYKEILNSSTLDSAKVVVNVSRAVLDFSGENSSCASPGDGESDSEINQKFRMVMAVRCEDGTSLERFAGVRAKSFLNTRLSGFCYGGKTGVLLELRIEDGESSQIVVLNDGTNGLCKLDFSKSTAESTTTIPATCKNLVTEQSSDPLTDPPANQSNGPSTGPSTGPQDE